MMRKKTKFKTIIFSQDSIKKSRLFAVIFTLFILGIIILQYLHIIPSNNFILKSNIAILFITAFLMIKPDYIFIWSIIGFIVFFVNIFVGGNLLGLFFYFASLLILLKYGFFRTHSIFKLCVLLVFFITAFVFQYFQYGLHSLKISIFNIVIVILTSIALFFLLAVDIKKYFTKKEQFNISQLELTERQYNCFILAMQGLTFGQIADKLYISESVIKKEMTKIYQVIDVKNYSGFLLFTEKYEIVE